MMKAIKNFMNKPWTWGTYFKLCGVCAGVWTALLAAYVAWGKWYEKKVFEGNAREQSGREYLNDHALLSF